MIFQKHWAAKESSKTPNTLSELQGGRLITTSIYPWTPKPWKMKVLNPQNMGYNL